MLKINFFTNFEICYEIINIFLIFFAAARLAPSMFERVIYFLRTMILSYNKRQRLRSQKAVDRRIALRPTVSHSIHDPIHIIVEDTHRIHPY